jgi:lauroyl/myristoyl acyltransferase
VHAGLRENVYTLLQARGWEILPKDAERAKLPGFITVWPHGENFEVLNQAFKEMYPEATASSDDVSLMVVWIGGRLPYQFTEPDEDSSTVQS